MYAKREMRCESVRVLLGSRMNESSDGTTRSLTHHKGSIKV